jgi:hypothetical protein
MILALKDIGQIQEILADSPLSQSPLWNKPVDQIIPAQLYAFVTRLSMSDHGEEARASIEIALKELACAVGSGEIPPVDVLQYREPKRDYMTVGELCTGLNKMSIPRPTAVIFALEIGASIEDVVTLTWTKAIRLSKAGRLSKLAFECLRSRPRYIRSNYVFWEYGQRNTALPLFGLTKEVFDIFGLVWGELAESYRNIILIDEASELDHLLSTFCPPGESKSR